MGLEEHIGYLIDGRRTELFRAAVAEVIRPGDVVADLGCGTGVLGLLCLEAGAHHVYGIDSGSIIEAARETFTRAGLGARATFIQALTHRITLPEKVDVLVCDHVGYFGFDYGLLRLLQDGVRRFLKPGGRVIPSRLTLLMAPVQSTVAWNKVAQWRAPVVPEAYHWLHTVNTSRKHPATFAPEDFMADLSDGVSVHLDQSPPEVLILRHEFRSRCDGMLDGVAGCFSCRLSPGIEMTNAPAASRSIDRPQAYLPLPEPVVVSHGERILITVTARPADDLIAWEVNLPERGQRYKQSSLGGLLLDPAGHRRMAPGYYPKPRGDAMARGIVLGYCNGARAAQDIVAAVLRDHPKLMPSADEISRFVLRVIEQDTE